MSPDKKNTNHEIEWNGESMPEGVPVSAVRTLMKYKKLMEHEILQPFNDLILDRRYENRNGKVFIPELNESYALDTFPVTWNVTKDYSPFNTKSIFSMALARYVNIVSEMVPDKATGSYGDDKNVLHWANILTQNDLAKKSNTSSLEAIFDGETPPVNTKESTIEINAEERKAVINSITEDMGYEYHRNIMQTHNIPGKTIKEEVYTPNFLKAAIKVAYSKLENATTKDDIKMWKKYLADAKGFE